MQDNFIKIPYTAIMKVALVSIGNAIGLAIENLKVYCEANSEISSRVDIKTYHYEIAPFSSDTAKCIQTFNFSTKFDLCLKEISAYKPDVIGFSCYLWNAEFMIKLAQMISELMPNALVIFGGPDAGPRAQELLKHEYIDIVINGDGENPFEAVLIELLKNGTPEWSDIPQLCYRKNEKIVQNTSLPISTNLNKLVGVYDQVENLEQFTEWRWPYLLYETMRGCPYQCSFCLYGKSNISNKEVDLVVSELVPILKKGYMVNLIDPTFTTFKKRAKEILSRLAEHQYTGSLQIESYPDSIDSDFVDLFVQSRVEYVGVGLQTVSREGLRASKRPKKKDKFEEAINLLSDAGIEFYIDVIYGLPDTTKEDFFATVDYLFELGVTNWQAYRLLGLPGSPMLNETEKYKFKFNHAPPYELLSSNTFSLEDIIECQEFIRKCFEFDNKLNSSKFKMRLNESGSYSQVILDSISHARNIRPDQSYSLGIH